MTYPRGDIIYCSDPSCGAWHPGGDWSAIRAAARGWYHDIDQRAYCPMHTPKWVRRWCSK